MPDVLIENPVPNSPFVEPTRHFIFDEDGITDEIAESRRPPRCRQLLRQGGSLDVVGGEEDGSRQLCRTECRTVGEED